MPTSTVIVPFAPDLFPGAARLLAQRHQRDRTFLPVLPERFAEPAVAEQAIAAAWQRKQASGVAALVDDQVVAYLIGDVVILASVPPSLEIRQAGSLDRHHLAAMSDVIWKTQVKAPVWAVMMPESQQEQAAGWADLVDEPDVTVWLALQDGVVVGCQGYWPAEQGLNHLFIPAACMHLSVAGTQEAARGQGIGTLLTRHGFAHARQAGYHFCEADWRSTNGLAARFWPRQGFQPVVYRLVRRLDQRIAWANGRMSI